jgi:hypothetical protein
MSVPSRPILCVVPAVLKTQDQLEALLRTLVSLWSNGEGDDRLVLACDDSDPALTAQAEAAADELGAGFVDAGQDSPTEAANAGLQLALDAGADVVLVDAGAEFSAGPWLGALLSRATADPARPAGIVGGRTVRPNGTIHRAGFLFSRLTRNWHARMEWAPADMPEALLPYRCPVGGAFELVRHEALAAAGTLDPRMPRPLDMIDLCLRVDKAGLDCVFEPAAMAIWNGTPVQWPDKAASSTFDSNWHGTDLRRWVPPIL